MTSPIFITKDGTLKRHENTVYFENHFQKTPIPLEQADEIFCESHVTMTSGAIHLLASREIPVHFFNHYGFYESSLWPRKKNVSDNIVFPNLLSKWLKFISPLFTSLSKTLSVNAGLKISDKSRLRLNRSVPGS